MTGRDRIPPRQAALVTIRSAVSSTAQAWPNLTQVNAGASRQIYLHHVMILPHALRRAGMLRFARSKSDGRDVARPATIRSSETDGVIACHECDLLNRVRPIPQGGTGKCARCGATVYREIPNRLDTALWLMVTSFILFLIANFFPLLTFKLEGREQVAVVATGAFELYRQGYWELGLLVLCLSIAFPLVCIASGLYVLLPIRYGRTPPYLRTVFRLFGTLTPWAMTEVYLLGLIVAYVKLSDLATLVIGPALYAFIALMIATTWSLSALDSRIVWRQVAPSGSGTRVNRGSAPLAVEAAPVNYIGCHFCSYLVDVRETPGASLPRRCPRCNASLHKRKPNSVERTWALLIAAAICYLPANLLPIMTIVSFGEGESDTIVSGVKSLIEVKMYPIALLVFFASICVPILKIAVLSFLLISVQIRSEWRTRERSILYRITELIGRWSMIDIFMISILAALVKLEALATIQPGPAAVFFAAVVILTMFAAMSFDSRLIWDAARMRPPAHAS